MQISRDVGLPVVKAFEGCLKPVARRPGYFTTYRCPANVLTIGYGHTNLGGVAPPIKQGDIWPQQLCEQALANDMANFERRISRTFAGVTLSQHEFDALVSFDFNTGGIDRSSIPAKIKSGRRGEVAETLARWNKAEGRELAGLTRRRKCEGLLFDGRIQEALRVAGTQRAGETMAQRIDRPSPPPAEVAKRAAPELATLGAGSGASAGGAVNSGSVQPGKAEAPAAPAEALATAATYLGAALVVVALILLARKYFKIDADWA